MLIEDFLASYWSVIVGLVSIIVWAIRIEGALRGLGQEVQAMKATRKEDQEQATESRREVHETLNVIQRDIKDILRATVSK